MSIRTKIVDSKGTGNGAKIDDEGAIHVIEHPHPPIIESVQPLPYSELFANSSGVTNMVVDGSTNSVDFVVSANTDFDIFIKTIFVEIADNGSPALNKFGSATALSTGVEWLYFTQGTGEYTLEEGLDTNKAFIKIGIDTHGIGTGVDAYLADTSGGGTEKAYLPIIDLGEMYGMRYGVRLKKGTTDKMIFRVNDNLTSLIRFTAKANGQRL